MERDIRQDGRIKLNAWQIKREESHVRVHPFSDGEGVLGWSSSLDPSVTDYIK